MLAVVCSLISACGPSAPDLVTHVHRQQVPTSVAQMSQETVPTTKSPLGICQPGTAAGLNIAVLPARAEQRQRGLRPIKRRHFIRCRFNGFGLAVVFVVGRQDELTPIAFGGIRRLFDVRRVITLFRDKVRQG